MTFVLFSLDFSRDFRLDSPDEAWKSVEHESHFHPNLDTETEVILYTLKVCGVVVFTSYVLIFLVFFFALRCESLLKPILQSEAAVTTLSSMADFCPTPFSRDFKSELTRRGSRACLDSDGHYRKALSRTASAPNFA